ncbi:MAG: tetratricopeptide repeat protein [Deltaproteobacteria bacterium]|nr:tetratricopeptide repeat protein [Deltaproteobacteria bacterium]
MKPKQLLIAVLLPLCGCATFEIQGEFTRGRQALLLGDVSGALDNFQRVAGEDPKFQSDGGPLRESIWTYIGRANYQSGKYPEARQALEKALAQNSGDHMARLYLGLALSRTPPPSAKPGGFSVQDISFALREGVEPERVAALARERGVAFDLSRDAESQLRKAGANTQLLDEIKKIRADITDKFDNQNKGAAKQLSTALTGLRNDLDAFIASTTQGRFWDPAGEIRYEINNNLTLLAARDPDWNKIVSRGEWVGQKLEEEIDRARRDESKSRQRQQPR